MKSLSSDLSSILKNSGIQNFKMDGDSLVILENVTLNNDSAEALNDVGFNINIEGNLKTSIPLRNLKLVKDYYIKLDASADTRCLENVYVVGKTLILDCSSYGKELVLDSSLLNFREISIEGAKITKSRIDFSKAVVSVKKSLFSSTELLGEGESRFDVCGFNDVTLKQFPFVYIDFGYEDTKNLKVDSPNCELIMERPKDRSTIEAHVHTFETGNSSFDNVVLDIVCNIYAVHPHHIPSPGKGSIIKCKEVFLSFKEETEDMDEDEDEFEELIPVTKFLNKNPYYAPMIKKA